MRNRLQDHLDANGACRPVHPTWASGIGSARFRGSLSQAWPSRRWFGNGENDHGSNHNFERRSHLNRSIPAIAAVVWVSFAALAAVKNWKIV
jgi:hypothetical protein